MEKFLDLISLCKSYIIKVFFALARLGMLKRAGDGGDASVEGDGEAQGGKGGQAGSFGSGGRGGNAKVKGRGRAIGGDGGHG
ncbi:MAG: hypothetical protein ACK4PK_02645 [Alphaproteobacteria bacterium]